MHRRWLSSTPVADVSIREAESGSRVVPLLGDDAVQSDVVPLKPSHGRLPQPDPVALATKLGTNDVETDKPIASCVGNRGDAPDRFTVRLADQEPAGVSREEALRIVQPRIPPLAGSEVHGGRKFLAPH